MARPSKRQHNNISSPNNNIIHHTQHFPTKKHIPPKALPSNPPLSNSHVKFTSKQQRRPIMPTFAVPDDDPDSFLSEQDGMEVEGESFKQEIDGVTRTANDRNWQAQEAHIQAQLAAAQQAAEKEADYKRRAESAARRIAARFPATVYDPTQSKYNLKGPTPAHLRVFPGSSPFWKPSMPFTGVPTRIGKRKRDESQPPARDTYISEPDTISNHMALRRVGGMVVIMYTVAITWLASAWNRITGKRAKTTTQEQEQEILAVETDVSGRKRRAVPGSFYDPFESPFTQASNSPRSSAENARVTSPPKTQSIFTVTPDPTYVPPEEPFAWLRAQRFRASASANESINNASSNATISTSSLNDAINTSSPNAAINTASPNETIYTSSPKDSMNIALAQEAISIRPTKEFTAPASANEGIKTAPTERITATAAELPGAFPSPTLPSPEDSQSPVVKQPQEFMCAYDINAHHEMPNLHEYTDTHRGGINSIEPTMEEMDERRRSRGGAATWDDYEDIKEQKRALRQLRDDGEYGAWAYHQDIRKRHEEREFWAQEDQSEDCDRMRVNFIAAGVKFGEDVTPHEVGLKECEHKMHHAKGTCEKDDWYQKIHEYDGLRAYGKAKVWEAEVAQDTEEYNEKQKKLQEGRDCPKTSAYQKFGKKRRTVSGNTTQQRKQSPPSVAAAENGSDQDAAGATKEESSRPTTRSSHKPASYKGGVEATPQRLAPGANEMQPWSWDKTMGAGKPLLKSTLYQTPKDKRVDDLVERSRKIKIESPQEAEYQKWKKDKYERSRALWDQHHSSVKAKKQAYLRYVDEENVKAERNLQLARRDWELKQAEKEAQDKEAARRAAEELAQQKAIEDELARQAEEAARLKAEEEAAAARKAEEEAQAAEAAHAQKQILIRPLDPEWEEKVKKAMKIESGGAIVATALDGTELRRHDFGSVLPQEGSADDASGWLNDNIVNSFLMAVCARKQAQQGYKRGRDSVPEFEMYHSGWYTTVRQKGGKVEAVKNWSKRKGIQGAKLLKAEMIFLPINGGGHWQLLIIAPQARTIYFLDSLRRKSSGFFKMARDWLAMELGPELYNADEWTESLEQSSLQTNTDDCGVFVAMNALAAGKGYPFRDVSAAKMPEARRMVAAVLLNGGLTGDWEL